MTGRYSKNGGHAIIQNVVPNYNFLFLAKFSSEQKFNSIVEILMSKTKSWYCGSKVFQISVRELQGSVKGTSTYHMYHWNKERKLWNNLTKFEQIGVGGVVDNKKVYNKGSDINVVI